MNIYRIAEMNIAVSPRYTYTKEYLKDYETDETEYELEVRVTDEMIAYEQQLNQEIHGDPLDAALCEAVAILRVICDYIIDRQGFFLHCSCLRFEDKAIIFTAPSGTGKSTHARLWREYFGEKVEMINDDKPLVREKDGQFIIYGTPWDGKHHIGNNISAPIGAVFFLKQSKENRVEKVDTVTALTLLLQQTVIPQTKGALQTLLDMLSRLIENVPMYQLYCNISYEAVNVAFQATTKN
ncbi:MAG: hypothetical protein IJH32_07355 [Ruminococcus sp.]|nr:hypothetical protein [Ruminococcus sp.]